MELATLALISAGINIVLQIIILAYIVTLVKRLAHSAERPPAASSAPQAMPSLQGGQHRPSQNRPPHERGFRDRSPEQRPTPNAAPSPNPQNPSVDKSLREINLRLKNAERSQEHERKRLGNGNFSREGRGDQNRPRQDNRGGGPRSDWRRQNRPYNNDRPGNGGGYRQDNQDADDRPSASLAGPAAPSFAAPAAPQNAPSPAPEARIAPMAAPAVPQSLPTSSAAPGITAGPAVENNQEVFHGRKMTVKRRMLPAEEGSSQEQANASDQPIAEGQTPPENPPIHFGRR
ncbi:MAG: hypothetical protein PHC61_08820 [Chitinivibrionales bacterium]|nr:hypothetical protein [Chitinivibrionales bacterium]